MGSEGGDLTSVSQVFKSESRFFEAESSDDLTLASERLSGLSGFSSEAGLTEDFLRLRSSFLSELDLDFCGDSEETRLLDLGFNFPENKHDTLNIFL